MCQTLLSAVRAHWKLLLFQVLPDSGRSSTHLQLVSHPYPVPMNGSKQKEVSGKWLLKSPIRLRVMTATVLFVLGWITCERASMKSFLLWPVLFLSLIWFLMTLAKKLTAWDSNSSILSRLPILGHITQKAMENFCRTPPAFSYFPLNINLSTYVEIWIFLVQNDIPKSVFTN